jgi:ParB-like chromosome segregation protein Spo0J
MTEANDESVALQLIEVGERLRKPDMDVIAKLAENFERHGLLQRIGVRARADGKYDLIWGRNRFEAAGKLAWPAIAARVYPPDTPDSQLETLEIVENLRRQELTAKEREDQTIKLMAALKAADERAAAESGNPVATLSTGRGHKGVVQKAAEHEGRTKPTVRRRVKNVEERIGEKIDPQQDSAAELHRKAAKAAATPAPAKERRQRSKTAEAPTPVAQAEVNSKHERLTAALRELDRAEIMPNQIQAWTFSLTDKEREQIWGELESLRVFLGRLQKEISKTFVENEAPKRSGPVH